MEYGHGGDFVQNKGRIDFSANINPLGMPRGCVEAAIEGIYQSVCYPDYKGRDLLEAIAKEEGVPFEYILLGNGAAELIYAICHALRPRKAMVLTPSFLEYERALLALDCEVIYYPLDNKKQYDLDKSFLEAIDSSLDLIFLCNPNNPTGRLLDPALLKSIIRRCEEEQIYLVVDECFLPFVEEEARYTIKNMLSFIPYGMVLRAFTKIYAMPGLRLGYLLTSNHALHTRIRGQLQPWNTSMPAQLAGIAALKDSDFLKRSRAYITKERSFLETNLQNVKGLHLIAGSANFIFFEASKELYDKLWHKGIVIRDCSNYKGLYAGCYRVAVRSHADNQKLLECLREDE